MCFLEVRGDQQLQLRGDFLPLGFLAVEEEKATDEGTGTVEDMSSLEAAPCMDRTRYKNINVDKFKSS